MTGAITIVAHGGHPMRRIMLMSSRSAYGQTHYGDASAPRAAMKFTHAGKKEDSATVLRSSSSRRPAPDASLNSHYGKLPHLRSFTRLP